MKKAILWTNKDISDKSLKIIMKEVSEDVREKASLSDKKLREKVKQDLSEMIKKRNVG